MMNRTTTIRIQKSPATMLRGTVCFMSKAAGRKGGLLHPILNPQTGDALEMISVASHKDKILLQCSGSDEHISSKCFSLPDLNAPKYISASVMSEILHSSAPTLRICSTTLGISLISAMQTSVSIKYFPRVQHNHQVSTSRTISAPCRSSRAISIASLLPPKSPLNLASAASNLSLALFFKSTSGRFIELLSKEISSNFTLSLKSFNSAQYGALVADGFLNIVPVIILTYLVFGGKSTKKI